MEEQNERIEETNWILAEIQDMREESFNGDKLPAFKLEENKIYDITVDFSKKFDKWIDNDGKVKKIVPIVYNGETYVWWIYVRNPIYRKILEKFERTKCPDMKVTRTGQMQNTRYNLLEE